MTTDIRCPGCGYSPVADAIRDPQNNTMPETTTDLLDYFEVCGCDEGNVMCPECAREFQIVV